MAIYVQMNNKSYRKGVGIIIVNSDLQFFLGKRIGADAWQFPQGGIDEGETPEDALYRELYEETGLERDKIEILDKSKFDTNGNYVIYKVDKRMLKWLLLGPKYAHWNNAEIGSHIKFERNPNIFERNIYQSMCYFHN